MKNILYTIIFLFFFHFSFSQQTHSNESLPVEWDHVYGGNQDEFYPLIVQTADSGYLLAGSSSSEISGDKTQTSRGGSDYWIVRTDKKGDKLWDKTYGGDSTDQIGRV